MQVAYLIPRLVGKVCCRIGPWYGTLPASFLERLNMATELFIAANCKHRNRPEGDGLYVPAGWCQECVKALVHDIAHAKNFAEPLLGFPGILSTAKHGYGVPPNEEGVYFTGNRESNLPWSVFAHHKGQSWGPMVNEYFGPIPFEVWDEVKKEEEDPETLQLLFTRYRRLLDRRQTDNGHNEIDDLLFQYFKQLKDEIIKLKETVNNP